MSTIGDGADAAGKVLGLVKDLPFWLIAAVALGTDVLLFVPVVSAELQGQYRPLLVIVAVLANTLALFKLVALVHDRLRERRLAQERRRTIHISPDSGQSFWHVARQQDHSEMTQIAAGFFVKNLTGEPIGLVGVRLLKPKIRGEVAQSDVLIRAIDEDVYGSVIHSGHRIPGKASLPGSAHMMIRGLPKQNASEPLNVTLGISDDEGNEHRLKMALRGTPPPKPNPSAPALEKIFAIADPMQKEIVSVLQLEVSRYEKHGRESGALGSVHVVYERRQITRFGQDMWISGSPRDQSIIKDPEAAELQSDNMSALLELHATLSSDTERAKFVDTLLSRLDATKGYLRISYFIVCVLWKVGQLQAALQRARLLPEDERKDFGLSNILLMLNGLLRYKHSDFTSDMLDQVDSFVHDLKKERALRINEKIAAIRARRISGPVR